MASPVNESGLAAALAEAEAAGVLPLTSACNVFCIFCSNRANPPGVRVWSVGPRSLADIEAAVERLAHLGEIVIGESTSRISEGEPLTHPRFDDIVRLARRAAPRAVLKLTTNGVLLGRDRAALLADLTPVEVTVSLNTASPEAYRRVCGLEHDPRLAVGALAKVGVPFHASVVAIPAVTGDRDLAETVRYLEQQGCLDCRVFAPGHTSFTDPQARRQMPTRAEVADLVEEARGVVAMPVTMEPPDLRDIVPRLAGVIRGTPAARAGLAAGDEIVAVEGTGAVSRVDAFRRSLGALRRRGRCRLLVAPALAGVSPERRPREVVLELAESERPETVRSGLVMDRDFDPADGELILGLAVRLKARRAVVLTSPLAARVMALGLEAVAAAGDRYKETKGAPGPEPVVVSVPSRTFGGSIACAGLLTVSDFAGVLASAHPAHPGDALFLPPLAFDRSGLDLLGRSPAELRPLLRPGIRLVVPGLLTL